jgi:hypothetical protein
MLFVDQLIEAWNMVVSPIKSTKKNRSIGDSVKFYYIATLPLLIIGIILLYALSPLLISHLSTLSANAATNASQNTLLITMAGLGETFIAAIFIIFWLIEPIFTLINAAIYHLFGKFIFKRYKNGYDKTFVALMYSQVAGFLLLIIGAIIMGILALISPILILVGFVIFGLFALWMFIISVISIANQQRISKLLSLLVIIGIIVVLFIIEMIILFIGIGAAAIAH